MNPEMAKGMESAPEEEQLKALLNKEGTAFIEQEMGDIYDQQKPTGREFWAAEERTYKAALQAENFFLSTDSRMAQGNANRGGVG